MSSPKVRVVLLGFVLFYVFNLYMNILLDIAQKDPNIFLIKSYLFSGLLLRTALNKADTFKKTRVHFVLFSYLYNYDVKYDLASWAFGNSQRSGAIWNVNYVTLRFYLSLFIWYRCCFVFKIWYFNSIEFWPSFGVNLRYWTCSISVIEESNMYLLNYLNDLWREFEV